MILLAKIFLFISCIYAVWYATIAVYVFGSYVKYSFKTEWPIFIGLVRKLGIAIATEWKGIFKLENWISFLKEWKTRTFTIRTN